MKIQDITEGYGRYYCSTDKKWKTRKGPKQTRKVSEDQSVAEGNPIDTDWYRKQQERQTKAKQRQQGVAEGSLNEFAPGGNTASSYYAVTANFVNDFAQQKQEELQDLIDSGWTKQDLAQAGTLQSQAADIAHFEQVRDGFLKGLKPGFDAYLQGDTQLKDQLGAYWQENDLPLNQDWEKIYGEPWGRDNYGEGVAEEKTRLDPKCWDGYKKDGTKMKGGVRVNNCVKEELEETYDGDEFFEAYGELWFNEDQQLDEAEYQGRSVPLGKPMQGDVKKFKVYVKNDKGNVVKVNFGDPDMKIRKSNPAARRSFRARHNCDNPGPRDKARYWSCRKW